MILFFDKEMFIKLLCLSSFSNKPTLLRLTPDVVELTGDMYKVIWYSLFGLLLDSSLSSTFIY